jgi:alpha-beta hydrolase superfamily lysophospholipase
VCVANIQNGTYLEVNIDDNENINNSEVNSSEKLESTDSQLEDSDVGSGYADPSYELLSNIEGSRPVTFSCPVDHTGASVFVKGWFVDRSKEEIAKYPPVILVHDLGENIGFYGRTINKFVENQFSVFCYDLRAHGCSGKIFGHIESMDNMVNDLLQVVAWVRYKNNGISPIIVAQGVGALVAAYFQKKYPKYSKSLILISPCFELAHKFNNFSKLAVEFISTVLPTAKVPDCFTPIFVGAQCAKRSKINFFCMPNSMKLSACSINVLLEAIDRLPIFFPSNEVPILILVPSEDEVCAYDSLQDMISYLGEDYDVTVSVVEGAKHDQIGDKATMLDEVFRNNILAWIKQHCIDNGVNK